MADPHGEREREREREREEKEILVFKSSSSTWWRFKNSKVLYISKWSNGV